MAPADIGHRRLLSQRVAGERLARPGEVARWMGAVQAQDYQQALWAVGVRTGAATAREVEEAIANREIAWTWPMRGTLHFVAAENVRWMLELLAPRGLATRSRLQQLELDEGVFERSARLFSDALRGGKRLARSGMLRLLAEAGINPAGQRGYHILVRLSQVGLLCLGPMAEKEQTFVLLDEWVPNARRLAREEALAELAAIYFVSRGPATVADFAHWTGLTLTDARAGHEAVRSRLVAERRDGREYWQGEAVAAGQGAGDVADVYLLPGFDEYLLGYKDRANVLAAEHAPKVVPGGNGVFFPTVVAGGQVVGTWKRALRKGGVAITVRPFERLDVAREGLAAAAERCAAFLGAPLASVEVVDA